MRISTFGLLLVAVVAKTPDPDLNAPDPNSVGGGDLPVFYDTSKEWLDAAFSKYVADNDYYGASVGVLYGDRLVYAQGRGFIAAEDAKGDSVVPVLGLSKTITAVAVYQLVERGLLALNDRVFGPEGILREFQMPEGTQADPRLYDITVNHLLHHTAGWDESQGPVYDPMMNTLLVALDKEVVDIAESLSVDGAINQYDIISFMMAQPLHFTPGSKVKPSNFGFCVLGRVIEEITTYTYEYWVKQNVLVPSGMWHTRLGPAPKEIERLLSEAEQAQLDEDLGSDNHKDLRLTGSVYDILQPQVLDSTLGWYSNVYDVGRLFLCLFKSGVNTDFALLQPETVELVMGRPTEGYPPQHQRWHTLGFVVADDGSFFLESADAKQGLNVFLFHKQSDQYPNIKRRDSKDAFNFAYTDDSTVVFLGYSIKHHKHMRGLAKAMLAPLTPEVYLNNAHLEDVADNDLLTEHHDVIVKYKLDEHRLLSYSNAMRMLGYYPQWIHGYSYHGHSYYISIFERAVEMEQLQFRVYATASKKHLIKFVADHLGGQLEVSFLQSFTSAAHDNRLLYVVVLSKLDSLDQLSLFDFGLGLDEYMARLAEQETLGYRPFVQSVDSDADDISVSFMMRKEAWPASEPPPSRSFMDLTFEEMQTVAKDNARFGYSLSYIDTFSDYGEPRFSAVFHRNTYHKWLLQNDVPFERLLEEANKWRVKSYTPKMMVAYEKDEGLHFAGLWVLDKRDDK